MFMKIKTNRRKFVAGSAKLGAGLLLWPTTSWSVAYAAPDALDQKIGRLFCLNMFWTNPPGFFLELIEKYHVGGVYLDRNSLKTKNSALKAAKALRAAAPYSPRAHAAAARPAPAG